MGGGGGVSAAGAAAGGGRHVSRTDFHTHAVAAVGGGGGGGGLGAAGGGGGGGRHVSRADNFTDGVRQRLDMNIGTPASRTRVANNNVVRELM